MKGNPWRIGDSLTMVSMTPIFNISLDSLDASSSVIAIRFYLLLRSLFSPVETVLTGRVVS